MKNTFPIILSLLFTTTVLFSATITVTSSADSGVGTLREAVKNANAGDEIVFASNVTSISLLDTIIIHKNLSITGDATNTTTLQKSSSGKLYIYLETDSSTTVCFNNITLKNFYNCVGGAIKSKGNLKLNNCKISNNNAKTSASGIYSAGELNAYNCTFEDNINGAVSCNNANFEGCTFKGNYCQNGGAINVSGGKTVSIKNCLFEGNSASTFGGAICNRGYTTIDNCIFRKNSASYSESGIGNAGEIIIKNSTFDGNQKSVFGNSSFLESIKVKATFLNCLFIHNTETSSSAGVLQNGRYATLNVINCTIADNAAIGLQANNTDAYGTKTFDNIYLYNNIFDNNIIGSGEKYDIYVSYNTNNPEQTILSTAYNNIIGKTNLTINKSNIIGLDPLFVGNGDYSLQAISPAIDAGNNTYYPYTEYPTDLANNYRINNNNTIDLGAYEFQRGLSAIKTPSASGLKIDNNNQIIVENTTEPVAIYNMMGQLVASGLATTGFTVPQAGVYLVCIGRQQVKVLIK